MSMELTAPLPRGSRQAMPASLDHGVVVLFLLGLVATVPISVGATVYLAEPFLLLVSFMALRYRAPAFRGWDTTAVLALALALLVVLVGTDIARQSLSEDYLRGWSRWGFFIVAFGAFTVLFTNRARVLATLLSLALGQIVLALVLPTAYQEADVWKFGLAGSVSAGVVVLLTLARARRTTFLLALGALAATDLYLGSRSAGLIAAAAGVTLFAITGRQRRRPSRRTLVKVGLVGVIAVALFAETYTWAASSGRLGPLAQEKYQIQSSGSLGFLIGGRSDVVAALYAIRDSPVLGYGSWPRDTAGFRERAERMLEQHGYDLNPRPAREDDLIPSHSFLLGSWVEAGPIGVAFWVLVLAVVARVFVAVARRPFTSVTPLVLLLSYGMAWSVFFSPFGGQERLMVPLSIATLLFLRHEVEGR
jgi:O-antigen ligase